ncbi:ATP-binding protein [Succinivibrio dextrinosolvens]|uniref:ATP-binding protein n=1 Tax=Succinivibrio dextrinosolvens TaxID=83771 RepID=UPI0004E20AD7|nr:ATP-binding protein [Succinivibrio dextrinosolvens]
MRETKTLEFKEEITNTFLKTVSAFANYETGRILFGVNDEGKEIGIINPVQACLDIENKINDSIEPSPEYSLQINKKTSVITLTVFEGLHKPYLYKSKAYRRNDSASIPVDRLELTRLILEGKNISFEELPADNQDLVFNELSKKLSNALNISELNKDTLKTLELYSDKDGFNKAGELLSDSNRFNGIDIVRFGENISIILDRENIENESVLKQYDDAINVYKKYYQYEQIKGSLRKTVSLIPEEAFREAIANAIVHRTWDINASIQISMYSDRIEVVSPGGLPNGIKEEEYRRGGLSVLRNRILGNVFLRLNMIERFGTGIRRINETYRNSEVKPVFKITENSIIVILPVLEQKYNLTDDEAKIFELLKNREMSSSAIAEYTGFGKNKVITILKNLVDKGYVSVSGQGRGIRYTRQ